jgi:hypothetical protein
MGLAGAERCCALENRKESKHIKDNASDFGHKGGSSRELQMSFVALRKCEAAVFISVSSIHTECVGKESIRYHESASFDAQKKRQTRRTSLTRGI